jgi:hypothetical protein
MEQKYIFEEAQQISDSFPLAICQYRIIDGVSRATCKLGLVMA